MVPGGIRGITMTKRIELPNPFTGYAVQRPGESQIDAVARSIARRIGGGASLHHARIEHWTEDRHGRRSTETYQMTFVYPATRKGGGYPVAGEYWITLDVERN